MGGPRGKSEKTERKRFGDSGVGTLRRESEKAVKET